MSGNETEIQDKLDAWVSSMNNLIYEAERNRTYGNKQAYIIGTTTIFDKALAVKEIREKLREHEKVIKDRSNKRWNKVLSIYPLETAHQTRIKIAKQIDNNMAYSIDLLQMVQFTLDEEGLLIRRNLSGKEGHF